MVYIRINKEMQAIMPKKLPNSVQPIVMQNQRYLKFKDLKTIVKKSKLQLYKLINRKDIVAQSQVNSFIQKHRRNPLQLKIINNLKQRLEQKKVSGFQVGDLTDSPGSIHQFRDYRTDKLAQQIYAFITVMALLLSVVMGGYFAARQCIGLQSVWSLFIACVVGFMTYAFLGYRYRCLLPFGNKENPANSQKRVKKLKKENRASNTFDEKISIKKTIGSKEKVKTKKS